MKKKRKIFNILLLIIFLVLGLMVRNSAEGILFDVKLLELIQTSKNSILLKTMKIISYLGAEMFLIPVMAIIVIYNMYIKKKKEALFLTINTLGSFLLNSIIKQVFQRTRPFDFSLVNQGGLSFPSGHSMVVMSMYLSIFYLLTRNEKNRNEKIMIGVLIGSYILLMGISRMYLGVHWPTDIIGGYICGYLLYDISKKIL